jgi:hypothetical protein
MLTNVSLGRRSGALSPTSFWSDWKPAAFHIGGRDDSDIDAFKTWLTTELHAFNANRNT